MLTTLDDVIAGQAEYIKFLLNDEMSENTIKKYTSVIRHFIKFARENNHCEELCKNCLVDYKNYLQENYEPATVNNYITGFNKYLKYIQAHNLCIKTIKIQSHSLDNLLDMEDYRKLLKEAKEYLQGDTYHIIRVIATTGIRVSELKYITVNAIKQGQNTVLNKGTARCVLIINEVCEEVLQYCNEKGIKDGIIFYTKNPNKCITQNTVYRRIKRVGYLAGIEDEKLFTHNLRHFFATVFMDVNKDLPGLADALGHKNMNTTRIYLKKNKKAQMKQLEKLCL